MSSLEYTCAMGVEGWAQSSYWKTFSTSSSLSAFVSRIYKYIRFEMNWIDSIHRTYDMMTRARAVHIVCEHFIWIGMWLSSASSTEWNKLSYSNIIIVLRPGPVWTISNNSFWRRVWLSSSGDAVWWWSYLHTEQSIRWYYLYQHTRAHWIHE